MPINLDSCIGRFFLLLTPSGWFGRPWDSMCRLESATASPQTYHLSFDNHVEITLVGERHGYVIAHGHFLLSEKSSFRSDRAKHEFGPGTYLCLSGDLEEELRLVEIHRTLTRIQSRYSHLATDPLGNLLRLTDALERCQKLQAGLPDLRTLQSVRNQIEYLIALTAGTVTDRTRLEDIILGVQAAREIEPLDRALADLLYTIARTPW